MAQPGTLAIMPGHFAVDTMTLRPNLVYNKATIAAQIERPGASRGCDMLAIDGFLLGLWGGILVTAVWVIVAGFTGWDWMRPLNINGPGLKAGRLMAGGE